LEVLCRVAAPLLPLITEEVWTGLTGAASVHLADWPSAADLPADPELVSTMDRVRDVCSAAHSVRKAQRLRARLPLAALTVAAPDALALAPFRDLIAEEVNVREVILDPHVSDVAERSLTVVFKLAAPRLGPETPAVAAAAKAGDWDLLPDGRARVGPAILEPDEFEYRLRPTDPATSRALPGDDGLVVLDTLVVPELAAEGLARDVVRVVQQARREAGLDVSDRIELWVAGSAALIAALETHRHWLCEATLAVSLTLIESDSRPSHEWTEVDLSDGERAWLRLRRAPAG
jgi:isoleucyl-tRNA synthetase